MLLYALYIAHSAVDCKRKDRSFLRKFFFRRGPDVLHLDVALLSDFDQDLDEARAVEVQRIQVSKLARKDLPVVTTSQFGNFHSIALCLCAVSIASRGCFRNRFPLCFFIQLPPILGQSQRAFRVRLEPVGNLPVLQDAVLDVILGMDGAKASVCRSEATHVIILGGVGVGFFSGLAVEQVHQSTTHGVHGHFVVAGDQRGQFRFSEHLLGPLLCCPMPHV